MSLNKPYKQSILSKSKLGKEIKTSEYYDCHLQNQMRVGNNDSTNESSGRGIKTRDVSLDYSLGTNLAIYNEPFTYKRIKPSNHFYCNRFEMKFKHNLSKDMTNALAQRKSNKISRSPSPIRKSNLLTTSNTSAYNDKCLKTSMNNNTNTHSNSNNDYSVSYAKYGSSSQCIKGKSKNYTSSYTNISQFYPYRSSNYKFYQALNDINQEMKSMHDQKTPQTFNYTQKMNKTTSTHYEYINPSNNNNRNENNYNYKDYIRNISETPKSSHRQKSVYNSNQSSSCERLFGEEIDRGYAYKANNQRELNKSNSIKESNNSYIKTTKRDCIREMESIDTIEEMHFSFVSMIQNAKKIISIQETFNGGGISQRDCF